MLARSRGSVTAFGGYLDTVLDMVAYSAIAVALAVTRPSTVVLWLLVVVGYLLVTTATLALSSLAERQNRQLCGNRSIEFTRSFAEAGETTLVYAAVILWPGVERVILMMWLTPLALTVRHRTALARHLLSTQ